MKLHLLSDLHLEFADFQPPPTDAAVVVLAGDIHIKDRAIAWAVRSFPDKPVVYVPGNHEYYGGQLGRTLEKIKAKAAGTNVHVLDNQELVLDGVRFLGATLWTDYQLTGNQPLAQWDAQMTLQDFKQIRYVYRDQYRKAKPLQFLERHFASRRFLEERLNEPFEGATVVVTHHAPTELSIHPRYKERTDHLNAAYANRLDRLCGTAVLWVHGHTHDTFDYDMYGTRVVCNPRGYSNKDLPDEHNGHVNQGFNPALVVEV